MIYIFDTEIPSFKSVKISLKNVYGLNNHQSIVICKKLGFSDNLLVSDLTNEQIAKLVKVIENSNVIINNELKKLQIFNLKLLVDIKSYKGLRRIRGLPVRGQRTHTNSKTAKLRKNFSNINI